MSERFGEFLKRKRMNANKTLRGFATEIGVAPPYISDIENCNRNAPEGEVLKKIIEKLYLSPEEETYAYDMVSKEKGNVAQDIPEYIKTDDSIKNFLRVARECGAEVSDWERFIEEMKNKKR